MSAAVCAAAQLPSAIPHGLPAPTGPFGIGRVTLLCEDASRVEPLDPNVGPRRIKVDVWYPADPTTSTGMAGAEYLNISTFELALGADGLRKQLGGAYDLIKDGVVKTHAVIEAPYASSLRRSPVLIFSPGGGMISELYASQLEDLASHGYIVAAITHSYDGFLTVFPDGSNVAYDSKRWPKQQPHRSATLSGFRAATPAAPLIAPLIAPLGRGIFYAAWYFSVRRHRGSQ